MKHLNNEKGFILAAIMGIIQAASFYAASAAAAIGFSAAGIAVAGALAGAVTALGIAYLGSQLLGVDVPAVQLDQGLLLNKQSANEPIPVVVGQRRVGGTIVFYETKGTNDGFLWMVVVFCEGEVESIGNVYFNDVDSNDARFQPGVKSVVYKHTGAAAQTADSNLVAAIGRWTTDHKLSGLCYVVCEFAFDENVFYSGVPTITADITGVKCYDPRTSTTIWSDNPAVIIRNYMVNTLYGRGISSSLIDDTSFISAANFCDELVTFEDVGTVDGAQSATATVNSKAVSQHLLVGDTIKFNGHATEYVIDTWADGVDFLGEVSSALTGTYKEFATTTMTLDQTLTAGIADNEQVHKLQKRYTCNGVISTDKTSMDILRELLSSCRGMLVFTGGKYKLIIDKAASSTFSFNASNIVGGWTISQGTKTSQFNRMDIGYFDPWRSWQPTTEVIDSTTYRTADNGLLLEKSFILPFTADANAAKQIGTINLQQSRQQVAVEFTSTIAATEVEVGDVIDITHTTPGWTAKEFRVLKMTLMNNSEVRLTVREYDSTVYDFGTLSVVDATPNTNLPDPFDINPPTSITVNHTEIHHDLIPQIQTRLSWTAVPNAIAYNLEYLKDNASKEILYIFQDNPATVWLTGPHDFADGDVITITGVVGMVELNNRQFTVTSSNPGAGALKLLGEDATGHTVYISGGSVEYDRYASLATVAANGNETIYYDIPTGLLEDGGSYTFRARSINFNGVPGISWVTNSGNTIVTGDMDSHWLIVGPHTDRGEYALPSAAVADVVSKGYNGIFIKNGTYDETTVINLPAMNLHILGQSEGGVIIRGPATTYTNIITHTASATAYKYRLENFTLTSRWTSSNSTMVQLYGTTQAANRSRFHFENVTFNGYGASGTTGDYLLRANNGGVSLTVNDCTFNDGYRGVATTNYAYVEVRNSSFNNQYQSVYVLTGTNITKFIDNHVSDFRNQGLFVDGGTLAVVTGNIVELSSGVTLEYDYPMGIIVQPDGSAVVTSNVVSMTNGSYALVGGMYGIYVYSPNMTVGNNSVDLFNSLDRHGTGIQVNSGADSTVTGNSVQVDFPTSGSGIHVGIQLASCVRLISVGNQLNLFNNDANEYGFYLASCTNCATNSNVTYNVGTAYLDSAGSGNTQTDNKDV